MRLRLALLALLLGVHASVGRAQLLTIESPDGNAWTGLHATIAGGTIVATTFAGPTDVVHQFDATTGALIRSLPTVPGRVSAVRPHPAGFVVGYGGSARLYDAGTGALLQTFLPPSPPTARFGSEVAALGDDALVASPDESTVYRFDAATGALVRAYVDPTPGPQSCHDAFFGVAMVVAGDLLLVGDPCDVQDGIDTGRVLAFDAAGGGVVRAFVNPAPTRGYQLGLSLAVRDGVLWAAAPFPQDTSWADNRDAGSVHRFDLATGALLGSIRNPSPLAGRGQGVVGPDVFGFTMAPFAGGVGIASRWQTNFNDWRRGRVLYQLDDDGRPVSAVRPESTVPGWNGTEDEWGALAVADGRLLAMRQTNVGTSFSFRIDVVGPCGNGVVDAGEACDDGNLRDGDCCTSACQLFVPPACLAATPTRASITLRRQTDPTKDLLSFSWQSTTPLAPADLGNPLAGSDWAICVLDDDGGTPRLRLSSLVPVTAPCPQSDACWKTAPTTLRYKAKAVEFDGIKTAVVQAGAKPKAVLKGTGALLQVPSMPLDGPVTVRVQRRDAPICFEAVFTQPQRSTASEYRARN